MSNETDPNAAVVQFLEKVLDDTTKHPSLRTMAGQVIISYNKKFGASARENNKEYEAKLRVLALDPHTDFLFTYKDTGMNSEFDDKILEARINAAFQVLK